MASGDDYLSGFERKLWALHHHLCLERQCYTLFKWHHWDATTGQRGLIQWFVPRDHDQCFEIVKWLEYELEKERTEDCDMGDVVIPGVDVAIAVMEFSGVDGYLDRDISEALARQMAERFKNELNCRNRPSP